MKKICYVTTLALSIKSFFIPQLKYLAQNGFDVTVICSPDDKLQSLLGENIRFIPVQMPRGISALGSIRAIRKLKRIFKREKFDLVQYSTPNAAFYASLATNKAGIKIRNYHLMGLRYLGESGLKRKILYNLERYTCKNSTHIECVSQSNLNLAVEDKLFPKEKAKVIWNGSSGGVDLRRFDIEKREDYRKEIRDKYNIKLDEFVFGFVGRITKDKGVNEILEAFSKTENAKLLMIGLKEGIETLDSRLYQASLENDNIIYTGAVEEIEKYYPAIDVLLFPSYREGFGNVVMEAGAMGTTAIVSNIPGPIDIVKENVTALIVPPKDSQSLFRVMQKMLDRNLNDKLSSNAVAFIRESFNQEILMEHILKNKVELLGK